MLIRETQAELSKREHLGCLWGELVDQWELALQKGMGASRGINVSSKQDYLQVLRTYSATWRHKPASTISPADVREAYDQILIQGRTRARQQKFKTAVDAVYKWGIEYRKVPHVSCSPTRGVVLTGSTEESKPEILSLQEIRKLLEIARVTNHLWYPIYAMALLTGMRSGELYALEWSDISFETKKVSVSKSFNKRTNSIGPTKGRYWREVPISGQLESLLLDLKIKRGHKKWVLPHHSEWTSGQQASVLREFCVGHGLPSVKFHSLRACFATQLLRQKIAPAIVMKICGWKELKTMQRYVRLAGIEIEGATDDLLILPDVKVLGRVVELFTDNR
jgi:integrase